MSETENCLLAGSYELWTSYEWCMVMYKVQMHIGTLVNVEYWRMYFTTQNDSNKLHIRHHQIVCTSLGWKCLHWISYRSVDLSESDIQLITHIDWIGKKKLNRRRKRKKNHKTCRTSFLSYSCANRTIRLQFTHYISHV